MNSRKVIPGTDGSDSMIHCVSGGRTYLTRSTEYL